MGKAKMTVNGFVEYCEKRAGRLWTISILFTSVLVWGSHTDDEYSRSGRTRVV